MTRKSTPFLIILMVCGLCFCLVFVQAFFQRRADLTALENNRKMVERLRLTDLALFTEARYMRNPSQTDLHSAFQDHPTALEHFPAGSFGNGAARFSRTP